MTDSLHAVDRLKQRFGSINRVAEAAGVKQNTVCTWRARYGVPLDAARRIVAAAPNMDVVITLEELFTWIDEDTKRRREAA